MKKRVFFLTAFLLTTVLASCSLTPSEMPSQEGAISNSKKSILANTREVKRKIYRHYEQWKGTKYLIGGLSRQGIDCSGLVYDTFRKQLAIDIPRSTELQANVGREIKRSELRAGDLVFFRTGEKIRHVGIYIEKGRFFHASTKKGVTISSLGDLYWKEKFWHARRVEM